MKKSYLPLLLCWACLGHLMMAMENELKNGTTYTIHINQDVPDNSSKNIIYLSQEKTKEFYLKIPIGCSLYEVEMMLILTATKELREELSNKSFFIEREELKFGHTNLPESQKEELFGFPIPEYFPFKEKYTVMSYPKDSHEEILKEKNAIIRN